VTLQGRLTLWAVALVAAIVSIASAVDLSTEISREFGQIRHDTDLIRRFATESVKHSIDLDLTAPNPEAAVENAAPRLSGELASIIDGVPSVVEIAACEPAHRIAADSIDGRIGYPCPNLPDWYAAVKQRNWVDRIRLLSSDGGDYEITDAHKPGSTFSVKLVVRPRVIWSELEPVLKTHLSVSALAIVGAMVSALIFFSFALRPLGRLGSMIDMIARGDYELPDSDQPVIAAKSSQDEFNVVASKVNMLGQQLRGAHAEFSDLKTNVERLLEELEDAVLIFARDRRLIAAAGSVERFLGRPESPLLGQTINDIFPPGTPLGLFLAQAVQTGRTLRNRRIPLGVGFALLTVEFLESNAAGGMLVRLRDPEATRQIGRQLQTADRLSAISRLTKGVAHEVKNPLNAILMHVELARMKLAHQDYDLDQQMDVITSEIMRLDRVVKTFLDFTRPVELNLTDIRIKDFMEEIAGVARPQATASGIEIVENVQVEDSMITVDLDLLKQAVFNILVNAIEAMPTGGTLRFEASLKGDDAEIRIADTGHGIPQEVKEKIYDLYFTTKESGSGIGLAMTYRIVQLHDGTIDFASEPGRGTTFVLRFPVSLTAA
jgi:signal transduction histidine kinase